MLQLSKLPSTPNVVTILENFFKHWAVKQLNYCAEKGQQGNSSEKPTDIENVCRRYELFFPVEDNYFLNLQLLLNWIMWQFLVKCEQSLSQLLILYSSKQQSNSSRLVVLNIRLLLCLTLLPQTLSLLICLYIIHPFIQAVNISGYKLVLSNIGF